MLMCIASLSLFFLVAILGYVLVNGASSIDWEFLTAMPVPAGEAAAALPMLWLAASSSWSCAELDGDAHWYGRRDLHQ